MDRLLARGVFNIYQWWSKEGFLNRLKDLKETQYYSKEKLLKLQWNKLKKMLDYAWRNVPYYQEVFKKTGIFPQEINNYQDFMKIPFLTKEKVRENSLTLKSKDYSGKIISYGSSGSTGEPLMLNLSPSLQGSSRAAQYRGFSWYGIKFGERGAKIWGIPLVFKERYSEKIKDWMMNRNRLSAFNLSKEEMDKFFKKCQRLKIRYLYGYASALYKFSAFLKEKKIDGRILNLKAVISTAEILYDFQREFISSAFGCPLANEYGAAEAGIIAFECPEGSMHITSENVYLEIIKNNKPARLGELGEIVVTTLENFYSPLIRYRLGDLGILTDKKCQCGWTLPLIEIVQGRNNDMVITPDNRYLHSEVFSYINRTLLNSGRGIKEFKIIQESKKNLLVLITKEPNLDEEAISFLKKEIYKYMSREMIITTQLVDEIPREKSGKIRYFVSELV